jgi:hypothetical protein
MFAILICTTLNRLQKMEGISEMEDNGRVEQRARGLTLLIRCSNNDFVELLPDVRLATYVTNG